MTSVTLRRPRRSFVTDLLDQLGDSWAIAVAEIVAVAAYAFGHSELVAAASGVSVLAMRTAAGMWPREDQPPVEPPRPRARPLLDLSIEADLKAGMSVEDVARKRTATVRRVRSVQEEVRRREPTPTEPEGKKPDKPEHWYENPPIRGTLTAAGFLSLAWTLFQILTRAYDYVSRLFGWA